MNYVYSIFQVICGFFAIYFGFIGFFAIFGKRKEKEANSQLKFAALIAARNEENCIKNSVGSLKRQNYPSNLLDVFVIPNNCTDNTENVAREAGAKIVKVPYQVNNKGMALEYAMEKLQDDYDAFVVFDADNELNEEFIFSINQTMGNGYRIVKSRICAKNRSESWVAMCYDIHFASANQLLNRGRAWLGLSARVIGTGFAVKTEFLKEIGGFHTETIAEDAEFYAICAAKGEKVGFSENAIAYDEEPLDFKTSLTQRKRWMSGIMQVVKLKFKDLIKGIFNRKSALISLDAFIQLTFSYVQALIPFSLLVLLISSPVTFLTTMTFTIIKGYSLIICLAVFVLAMERRMTMSKNEFLGILLYPFFVATFIPLQTVALFKKTTVWREIKHSGKTRETLVKGIPGDRIQIRGKI